MSIISNSFIDQKKQQAIRGAEMMASQIISEGYKSLYRDDAKKSSSHGRTISSQSTTKIPVEGRIGMDPWSHPYYYKVFEYDEKRKVFVLSFGADGVRNSVDNDSLDDTSEPTSSILRKGDDILSVMSSS
ncbi:MAG: hypothetical protein A2Z20_04380 [Bdellovibrionales bacterium RBG_16_40_8]|nr:MAG: hypothetical protein A2Z20_04380 [Bdellovibrionales bacterium RBG_16_40_8]